MTPISYDVPFKSSTVFSGKVDFISIGFGKPDQHASILIGELFQKYPDPTVTVVSNDSIKIPFVGVMGGSFGEQSDVDIQPYDPYPPSH